MEGPHGHRPCDPKGHALFLEHPAAFPVYVQALLDGIVRSLFNLWVIGKRFVSEACRIAVRQLLSDGSEMLLWVCKLLLGTICISHPAYQLFLMGQFLLPLIIVVQVSLVIARTGGCSADSSGSCLSPPRSRSCTHLW